jgi:ATP-dependent phosphoenolpyruvate carboxykinase
MNATNPPHSISPVLSVSAEILRPSECWADKPHDATATKLAGIFNKNFGPYAATARDELKAAAPAA